MKSSSLLFILVATTLHCLASDVRVRNASDVDFTAVRINDRDYGDIKAGATGMYIHREHAWAEAHASVNVSSSSQLHCSSPGMPGHELGEGKFTFTLTVVNGSLDVKLSRDDAPAVSTVPMIAASAQSPQKFEATYATVENPKNGVVRTLHKSSWRAFGNKWEETLPSSNYIGIGMQVVDGRSLFSLSAREKVNGRPGIVILSDSDPGLEVFIPDKGTPEPTAYYRRNKGQWQYLSRMSHME